ncbi:hypothetical protein ACH4OY_12825 [Micromonospora rubida]|uniref:Uncharacterized protein n=1 Tax=Micromonospora rubida TaxID=2697657 RepID=A0ABW7SIS3_9ACTN
MGRATLRLEHLIAGDADLAREKVTVVDDELPVTVRDLLALLRDKEPAAGPATRRHVATTAISEAGGDTGVLRSWPAPPTAERTPPPPPTAAEAEPRSSCLP